MSKIIIENRSDIDDIKAVEYVAQVIMGGRVSNHGKQYCYFSIATDGIGIASYLNKKSDRFVVTNNYIRKYKKGE